MPSGTLNSLAAGTTTFSCRPPLPTPHITRSPIWGPGVASAISLVAVSLFGLAGAACAGSARAVARGAAWPNEGDKAAGGEAAVVDAEAGQFARCRSRAGARSTDEKTRDEGSREPPSSGELPAGASLRVE